MRKLAAAALIILSIIIMAVYLPMLYEKLFFDRVEKTHLFYSPVSERFIFLEKIVRKIPPESLDKAEDHHAEMAYRDQDGAWYTRVEFEKQLPFIYYKNMELWGLLPITLSGRELDKKTIKKNRRVLEFKPGDINDLKPGTPLWPLLESNTGQVRLVFPEDRFRMTADAMVFVNADYNIIDQELTDLFTKALKDKGFVFPARSVNGKFTVLKPFDEGAFIVDDEYKVFHIKRRDGKPVVVKTPIDPALKTRHIKISENKRREHYGLLLSGRGDLYLISYDNYKLTPIPLKSYDPDRMDFKLIFNPLYRTAVYSDDAVIRAVAMDLNYQTLARYEHRMSRSNTTPAQTIYKAVFPFSVHLKEKDGGHLKLFARTGGWISLIGMIGSLVFLIIWRWIRQKRLPEAMEAGLVFLTGIYGLISLTIMEQES